MNAADECGGMNAADAGGGCRRRRKEEGEERRRHGIKAEPSHGVRKPTTIELFTFLFVLFEIFMIRFHA